MVDSVVLIIKILKSSVGCVSKEQHPTLDNETKKQGQSRQSLSIDDLILAI